MAKVRLPGIEPEPSRWQRDIITTRLKTLQLFGMTESRRGSNPRFGLITQNGAKGESNPRPLAPEARIIPLDHWPATACGGQKKVTSGFEPLTARLTAGCSGQLSYNGTVAPLFTPCLKASGRGDRGVELPGSATRAVAAGAPRNGESARRPRPVASCLIRQATCRHPAIYLR